MTTYKTRRGVLTAPALLTSPRLTVGSAGAGGVWLRVLRDGRYLVLGGQFLRYRHPPGVQVREEATGVHLGGVGERHGVRGDHRRGHAVHSGVLATPCSQHTVNTLYLRYRVSVTPAGQRGRHGVLFVEAPVRSLRRS